MGEEHKNRQTDGKYHKSRTELEEEFRQIEAAQQNPGQFHPLYDTYYKPIFVFVFRRTGNEDLCADITSQVFLKALIHLKKYKFQGVPFSAWLFRIAFNEVALHFRKNNTQRSLSFDADKIQSIAAASELDSTAETDRLLMESISELQEDAIQLIELRFFEARPFSEVAQILGITESNAKIKVYRVLEKLKLIILKKKINFVR